MNCAVTHPTNAVPTVMKPVVAQSAMRRRDTCLNCAVTHPTNAVSTAIRFKPIVAQSVMRRVIMKPSKAVGVRIITCGRIEPPTSSMPVPKTIVSEPTIHLEATVGRVVVLVACVVAHDGGTDLAGCSKCTVVTQLNSATVTAMNPVVAQSAKSRAAIALSKVIVAEHIRIGNMTQPKMTHTAASMPISLAEPLHVSSVPVAVYVAERQGNVEMY